MLIYAFQRSYSLFVCVGTQKECVGQVRLVERLNQTACFRLYRVPVLYFIMAYLVLTGTKRCKQLHWQCHFWLGLIHGSLLRVLAIPSLWRWGCMCAFCKASWLLDRYQSRMVVTAKNKHVSQIPWMITMGGDLQPGYLADWLLTGLGQPQIYP
jgi:hypothetical protein